MKGLMMEGVLVFRLDGFWNFYEFLFIGEVEGGLFWS